jgi:hypothetical protein
MSFSDTVFDVLKKNTVDPVKRVSAKTNSASFFDKPGTMVAETLKEGLIRLPAENILRISSWTTRKIFSLLGSTLKTGLLAATLIPLPLPGGKSVADIRGDLRGYKEALFQKARGNPGSFGEIFANIRGIRKDAEARATTDGGKTTVPA